jgi:CarboxypepD_reg-like domain
MTFRREAQFLYFDWNRISCSSIFDMDPHFMQKYGCLIALLFLSVNCFSQHIVKGRIVNGTDSKPIPYANIGIINSSVGTLSNEDGTFLISIPIKHRQDTLLFSALGYDRQFIPVLSLFNERDLVISLAEKVIILEQVIVSAKKKKEKSYLLGNRFTNGGFLYADSVSAGAAMALMIENKYPAYHSDLTFPCFVEDINIYIHKNSVDNFKIRVRFLKHDLLTGQPDDDLLAENVIVTSSIRKGWIKVDLRSYHLIVNESFFLVLEWIMDDKDRLALVNQYAAYRKTNPDQVKADSTLVDGKKIGFWSYLNFSPGTRLGVSSLPFSLQNYTCYYRTNSFGEWKRAPVILTARVSVSPLLPNVDGASKSK